VSSNLAGRAINKKATFLGGFFINYMQRAGFELGSTNSPGANFERPQAGPKGGGQDARSNLAGRAINKKATFLGGFFINYMQRAGFELGSTACTS
jgi:hypothetical protein